MRSRFVERKDADALLRRNKDFKLRTHDSFYLFISCAFIAALSVIIITTGDAFVDLMYVPFSQYVSIPHMLMNLALIVTIMLVLALYIYFMVSKLTSIVLRTEFQSALLSGVAKVRTLFCCIVSDDRLVVYIDENCSKVFAKNNKTDHLTDILAHDGLTEDAKNIIEDAVVNCKNAEVALVLEEPDGKQEVTLVVDPIDRPKGFVAIRGYKAGEKF